MHRPTFRGADRTTARRDFVHDLSTGRLGGPRWAVVTLVAGVAAGYAWNTVGAPVGAAVIAVVGCGLAVVVARVDRDRWRAQDVFLWQHVARTRRWIRDTGGEGPGVEPGRADAWLATHPRGSVPQVYRVLAASAADEPVVHQRELDALQPATPEEAAWKDYATVAPRIEWGSETDLEPLRRSVDSLPEGDDRAQLLSSLAIAESLARHERRERPWLQPLVDRWPAAAPERITRRQAARLWLARFLVLPAFLVPALLFAATGLGAAEPYPRAYLGTTFATRGDLGEIDQARLLRALPALAEEIGSAEPLGDEPLSADELDVRIRDGLPTLIWTVDAIDVGGPRGVGCDHIWSIETLLADDQPGGPAAIVTCDREQGPAFLMPVDPATAGALRAALGLTGGG